MDMIGHTTDAVGLAMKIFCNTIDIGIQFPFVLDRYCFLAAIGAKDKYCVPLARLYRGVRHFPILRPCGLVRGL